MWTKTEHNYAMKSLSQKKNPSICIYIFPYVLKPAQLPPRPYTVFSIRISLSNASPQTLISALLMADWGPVLIGVVLFVLLQPGLLFQLPGNGKQVEFGSMKTNGKAIAVHTLIFFTIYSILILAVHVHIYTG